MVHFDSDYMRGAHPMVLESLIKTNNLQTPGYGTDEITLRTKKLILDCCGLKNGGVWFLTGGTQTNATVIDAILSHHQGVISTESAHINTHEAGAIESTGHKVIALKEKDGKLKAEDVDKYIVDFYSDESWEHCVAPGMVYISHPTEYGQIYTLEELRELSNVCHKHNIPLYLDGARLGYALASYSNNVTLKDIARLCDVFYIGGTKVGTLFGEAVVTSKPSLLKSFFQIIKRRGALLAKGRLTAVQFETLFTDDLYTKLSKNAIRMAIKIKEAFINKGYSLYIDSSTNQQFFLLPNETIDRLREVATFELWGPKGEKETPVRFVTDWGTTEEDVDLLIKNL